MYRLEIYQNGELVSLIHGGLDDIAFVFANLKFAITMRFRITSI